MKPARCGVSTALFVSQPFSADHLLRPATPIDDRVGGQSQHTHIHRNRIQLSWTAHQLRPAPLPHIPQPHLRLMCIKPNHQTMPITPDPPLSLYVHPWLLGSAYHFHTSEAKPKAPKKKLVRRSARVVEASVPISHNIRVLRHENMTRSKCFDKLPTLPATATPGDGGCILASYLTDR
jgi:hypothetical protein